MSISVSSKHSIKDLPCVKVLVYQDRAEVKRLIKAKLKKGENELVINNVSNNIDQDSVRVEGRGDATVLDVVCKNKRVIETNDSITNEKVKEIKNEIKELETAEETTQLKLERVTKQTSVLNDFAASLSKPTNIANQNNSAADNNLSSSKTNVENFMNFLDTYSNRLEQLDDLKFKLQKELTKIREKINVAQDNLSRLNITDYSRVDSIEITILVEAQNNDTEVFLYVSYLVQNASWIPKYDIRVFSKDKSMIINYFGMITQSTGEDWNDTKISLSTAVPSIGGNVPELLTQNVGIKRKETIYKKKHKGLGSMSFMKPERFKSPQLECQDSSLFDFEAAPKAYAPMQYESANVVKSSIGSTSTFDISRNATIPSDNNSHKVSIGIINLKPEFEYESVPRKNTHAFIKAKVKNDSKYLIIAGQANVFFDNNFVAKTELKSYSPQEEFTCSLGIDSGIRIDYKPLKKLEGQTGLVSKYTNTTYVQRIEVKNTTSNNAKILIQDNLPLSNDEKIQVKLLKPSLKNNTNAKLNKSNNIEFNLILAPSKTEELVIKYIIEHHADLEIDFF